MVNTARTRQWTCCNQKPEPRRMIHCYYATQRSRLFRPQSGSQTWWPILNGRIAPINGYGLAVTYLYCNISIKSIRTAAKEDGLNQNDGQLPTRFGKQFRCRKTPKKLGKLTLEDHDKYGVIWTPKKKINRLSRERPCCLSTSQNIGENHSKTDHSG